MASRKDVADVVSGMGLAMSIITNLVKAVRERGGSDEDIHRLATPEGENTLVEIAEVVVQTKVLRIWKTIKLGTGLKTADEFRKALKDGGFSISSWASDILDKPAFTAATAEIEISLVNVSGEELGFTEAVSRDQIYARAKELGLRLCPAEVGPQLRLQYRDQPMNEALLIGMEPIADSYGSLEVFSVRRGDGGLWLSGSCGGPDYLWSPDYRWAFLRGK